MKIMRKLFLIFNISFLILLSSCASNPEPAWIADTESVYPPGKYITGAGFGNTADSALAAAHSSLAQYFSTTINGRVLITENRTTSNNITNTQSGSMRNFSIETEMTLFAINSAKPYYNSKRKNYEALVYIERAQAWKAYEPKVKQASLKLSSLMDAADNESESLKKVFLYNDALLYADEAGDIFFFGELIDSLSAAKYFNSRKEIANIMSKITAAKNESPLFIKCNSDLDGIVTGALTETFSKANFPVEKKSGDSSYTVNVEINENKETLEAGIFYTPVVKINIEGKTGTLWSWSRTAERHGAVNADIAKRRCYETAALLIRDNLGIR